MVTTHNLGFPRIGARRELKSALEGYWQGKLSEAELYETGKMLRAQHWQAQQEAGLTYIPVGDFAWYDHMLNMTALLGAAPARFGFNSSALTLEQYFALARGTKAQGAMELTKWFDSNYHYLVPEFSADSEFQLGVDWLFREVEEAKSLGLRPKPVLIGPLTYLYLGKEKDPDFNRWDLLPKLLPVYKEILSRLKAQGIEWVQVDEPALALDLPAEWLAAFQPTYVELSRNAPSILLATYFASVARHAPMLKNLPVSGLHIDAVRAPEQVDVFLDGYPLEKILSIGIIDGRNVWKSDLDRALGILEPAYRELKARLWVAPSCSLLHVPIDLSLETALPPESKNWLAFAVQKLDEISILAKGLIEGTSAVDDALRAARQTQQQRRNSPVAHNQALRQKIAAFQANGKGGRSAFSKRQSAQKSRFKLPLFPTTTIGSFPQTSAIRKARADYKHGKISAEAYQVEMAEEIRAAVARQEAIGLDVLVHGEAERNDMVEYFGEQLQGFAFTQNGWVQSYGSRCVKPPIIFGDVYRTKPMTVEWSKYAQSLTAKPMKGMLTGPVTILQWSFVRDDQPRAETAMQIALAIRDEVCDLEAAGIGMIQIDEPALREGLPLRRAEWEEYLRWAVHAFQVAAGGVKDETQIHTHMCYSEFNAILPAIVALDADVITIETARSKLKLFEGLDKFPYPNEIGPGIYDIHSPHIPNVQEMVALLEKARAVIPVDRLWVNPDCGLKTRGWEEVETALVNMVEAAKIMRAG